MWTVSTMLFDRGERQNGKGNPEVTHWVLRMKRVFETGHHGSTLLCQNVGALQLDIDGVGWWVTTLGNTDSKFQT